MRTIIETLREDLVVLHEAGAIGTVTLRGFNALCPPPLRAMDAAAIQHLRKTLRLSQRVFARHLNTSVSSVRRWEQGQTRPAGPALKLLNLIANKGLQALL